jgi:hypothetical protein
MIGKIQKAKQYAEERDRIEFTRFSVTYGERRAAWIGRSLFLGRLHVVCAILWSATFQL